MAARTDENAEDGSRNREHNKPCTEFLDKQSSVHKIEIVGSSGLNYWEQFKMHVYNLSLLATSVSCR